MSTKKEIHTIFSKQIVKKLAILIVLYYICIIQLFFEVNMISNNNKFFSEMNQLMRMLTVLDRNELVCYGVTVSQCYTIKALFTKKRLTMNELSSELGLAVSTLTRIIDILVRDEIVIRERSADDRRKIYIKLTEKGKDLAIKLRECSENYMMEILEYIPVEKRTVIVDSLEMINNAVISAKDRCCI